VDEQTTVQPYHEYRYRNYPSNSYFGTPTAACKAAAASLGRIYESYVDVALPSGITEVNIQCYGKLSSTSSSGALIAQPIKSRNGSYNSTVTNPLPTHVDVSDSELQTALKNALESNNPALAAAIAQAVKDA